MHLFPREQKFDAAGAPIDGAYFFGHFGSEPLAPFSVSEATFYADYTGEKPHYHETSQKVYIVLEGEGILKVGEEEVLMSPAQMIHVEPGEVHAVQKVLKAPLHFVAVTSAKVDDKVVLRE